MKPMGMVFVACALTVVGCSTPPAATPPVVTFDVAGTMSISRVLFDAIDGDSCSGIDGYDDIRTGAQVKVTDSTGKVVGLGALKAGLARDTNESWRGTNLCVFEFTVRDIPREGNIFGVEVSHRGVIQFTQDQAESLALTLN
jgi:hypothetical protein